MKKFIKLFVALSLCGILTLLSSAIDFEYTTEQYYDEYGYEHYGAVILEYTGSSTRVVVPAEIDGYPVIGIGDSAFEYSSVQNITLPSTVSFIRCGAFYGSDLVSIKIPNSVSYIDAETFANCSSLTSVTMPSELFSIEDGAFSGCTSLSSISLPNTLANIGYSAFLNCTSLASITFPSENGLTVRSYAFANTALKTVHFPENVDIIGEGVFAICKNLTSVTVDKNHPYLCVKNNCLMNGDEGILLALNNATVANSVIFIDEYAFSTCTNLTSINIPKNVEYIGAGVFAGCANLTSITVDKDNQYFRVENGCLIENYGSGNVLLGATKNAVIPEGVEVIGKSAFRGSQIKSVNIPATVNVIENFAFSDSAITKLEFDAECHAEIYDAAFSSCQISELYLPGAVRLCGEKIFQYCSALEKVVIENGMDTVAPYTFAGCEKLSTVTLPDTLTNLFECAFAYCESLKTVSFGNAYMHCIGESAFLYCTALESITMPCGFYEILPYTFYGCSALKDITFPIDCEVPIIGKVAFAYCSSLKEIILPQTLNYIDVLAFANCTSLEYVDFPYSLNEINGGAFYGCKNIKYLVFFGSPSTLYTDSFESAIRPTVICHYDSNPHGFAEYMGYGTLFMEDGWICDVNSNDEATVLLCVERRYPDVCVPPEFDSYPVTAIDDNAFVLLSQNQNILVPPFVETISKNAFSNCLATICCIDGSYAENYFKSKGIAFNYYFEELLYKIVDNDWAVITGTFYPYMTEIQIPENVGYEKTFPVFGIGGYAFWDNGKITDVSLPYSLIAIGDGAFMNCKNLQRINFPENLESIGAWAFFDTAIENVHLTENFKTLGEGAFFRSGLHTVEIPEGITEIPANAFSWCKNLSNLSLPESLEKIGEHAFSLCYNLEHVEIPENVTSIGNNAFDSCINLRGVYFLASEKITSVGENAFANTNEEISFHEVAPSSVVDRYAKANGIEVGIYKQDNIYFYIEDGVATIVDYYSEEEHPNSLNISTLGSVPVKRIAEWALYGFEGSEITLSSSVEFVDYCAFPQNLERITVKNRNVVINESAFSNCDNNLVIVCHEGSAADIFARQYGFEVEYLPAVDIGDADGDGTVTIRDAARILQYKAGWNVELG